MNCDKIIKKIKITILNLAASLNSIYNNKEIKKI